MASASVPQRQNHLTLPELLSQHAKNTPRRYEQTKPVLIQSFTHHSIIDLGREIHQRTLQRCAEEHKTLVQATQEAIRAEAARDKTEALTKAAHTAKLQQEKTLARMSRLHEKTIKAEMFKVETELKGIAMKQVKKEREIWQRKLTEAVLAKEDEMRKIGETKVEEARKEERENADLATKEKEKEHKQELTQVVEEAQQEREKMKSSLEELKEREKSAALADTQDKEQMMAHEKMSCQKQLYERQITTVKTMLKATEDRVDEKIAIIKQLHRAKKSVEKELRETRKEFETFITEVKPYQGEPRAEYVMPPQRSMKDGKQK